MSAKTKIEWTDATWNPIRGCSRLSSGCRHCYAERIAVRFSKPGEPYDGLVTDNRWNGRMKFIEEHLEDPLHWRKPRRIFVNSMSDLFHTEVSDENIDRIFAVMARCPRHTFQILTKRADRMFDYLTHPDRFSLVESAIWRELPPEMRPDLDEIGWPLPNVWLGVSIENQSTADERIPLLLQTPAALRFLSCEPLLGPIDLRNVTEAKRLLEDALSGADLEQTLPQHSVDAPSIGWVIVGGESGRDARPMHPDWARSIRDQCRRTGSPCHSGIPFFFKQWGSWLPYWLYNAPRKIVCSATGELLPMELTEAYLANHDGPRCAGSHQCMSRSIQPFDLRLLDDQEWNEFPEAKP